MDINRIHTLLIRKSPEGPATHDATVLNFLSEFARQPDVLGVTQLYLSKPTHSFQVLKISGSDPNSVSRGRSLKRNASTGYEILQSTLAGE
jgi:hypothetical protein